MLIKKINKNFLALNDPAFPNQLDEYDLRNFLMQTKGYKNKSNYWKAVNNELEKNAKIDKFQSFSLLND